MYKLLTVVSSCALLAGCNPNSLTLSPAQQSRAQALYDVACAGTGVVASLKPAAASGNANVQNAYAAVVQMCANGVPTNIISLGLDAATIAVTLQPYLGKNKTQIVVSTM